MKYPHVGYLVHPVGVARSLKIHEETQDRDSVDAVKRVRFELHVEVFQQFRDLAVHVNIVSPGRLPQVVRTEIQVVT